MDSDEIPTIDDPADAAWAAEQRSVMLDYLKSQRVEHAGVSNEPRWFLSPYVAIWAVRSKAQPDRIGWWAISGDLPTDYISCTTENSNAEVLLSFARQWKAAAAEMALGRQLPNYQIGVSGREMEFAPMLLTRAELLEEIAGDLESPPPVDQD